MIPYPEGKYRPASVPFMAGYYPYNMYLQKGKVLLRYSYHHIKTTFLDLLMVFLRHFLEWSLV